ncbi:HAD family hydrolase [Oceaniglobus ichthyenteri]|uniref:HAD family hydrolase n=1 Tax=Oceaniglobus ichthyenteri TaxID=2136177 RepID=UPI000D35FD9B|nr:HAD family hydrolase [Oceaniglobus ichthyenteri]
MTIKAILFDKDGTLLDYHATWTEVNLQAAKVGARGNPALARQLLALADADPDTGMAKAGGLLAAGNSAQIAQAWITHGVAWTLESLGAQIDEIFVDAMHRAIPIPGGAGLIRTLAAQGIIMGVASSDSAAAIRVFLDSVGLAEYFQFIAGYDSGYGHKPDPAALLAFADEIGAAPNEIAMVGDNIQDLQLGRDAGAGMVVGVLSGTGSAVELAPLATVVVPDISHLAQLLSKGVVQNGP